MFSKFPLYKWRPSLKVGLTMFRIASRYHYKESVIQTSCAVNVVRSYASVQSLKEISKKEQDQRDSSSNQPLQRSNNVRLDIDNASKRLSIDASEFGINKVSVPYVWLRDSCQRAKYSVDASTKQKLFQTSDICDDLEIKRIELITGLSGSSLGSSKSDVSVQRQEHEDEPLLVVEWNKEPLESLTNNTETTAESGLKSIIPMSILQRYLNFSNWQSWTRKPDMEPSTWHRNQLLQSRHLKISYQEFCQLDEIKANALRQLITKGIVFFTNVPTDKKSDAECELAKLGAKLGDIRRTWYGDKVWDVKSQENSKNVAYTNLSLGLHMDLVHYENPPRYQLLHYLHSHAHLTGGQSYFVDSYKVAEIIRRTEPEVYETLCKVPVGFEYRNGGHWRHYERPTFELRQRPEEQIESDGAGCDNTSSLFLNAVNYSPPFQAPQVLDRIGGAHGMEKLHHALRTFASLAAQPELTFRIDMKPGDCVAFDNRRVLHARTAFDMDDKANNNNKKDNINDSDNDNDNDNDSAATDNGGNGTRMPVRWLKGAYVEGDSVADTYRVLCEELSRKAQ